MISGALAGVFGAVLRLCLLGAATVRGDVLAWAHQWPLVGWWSSRPERDAGDRCRLAE